MTVEFLEPRPENVENNATSDHHVVFDLQDTSAQDPVKPYNEIRTTSVGTEETDIGSSIRSMRSNDSGSAMSSTRLRGNLTRLRRNCDPRTIYDVVQVLGMGSMGNVTKVKKKMEAIGGSARKDVSMPDNFCFQLPLIGGMFQSCMRGNQETSKDPLEISGRSTGSNGSVRAITVSTAPVDLTYAMKSIHLNRLTDQSFVEELKNEVEVLKSLDHPHVVRAIETYEYHNQIFVVMECCTGGDLYSRDPYSEEDAARIIKHILSAISYMHARGISHRDIKYENILFVNKEPRSEVKLIDFGLSKFFAPEDLLTDGVGTIYTMAPEVLKQQYNEKADLWSIGVIAYMLLSSQMPFYGRSRMKIAKHIATGKYDFKGKRWNHISREAHVFVEELFVVNPDERMSADKALQSVWLSQRHSAHIPHVHEVSSARDCMVKFADYSKLRKLALMVIAHKSTSLEIGNLRRIFHKYDTVADGHLEYSEFKAAVMELGLAEDECQRVFEGVDMDGTGQIHYTEFLASTIEAIGQISEDRLAEAFDRLDSDDSGYITAENLSELLGDEVPLAEIKAIIEEADIEKDGRISYAEFLALWEDTHMQECDGIVKEITFDSHGKRGSIVSTLSADDSEHGHDHDHRVAARAAFLDGKMISQRHLDLEH